jgi:hypothetical protein
MSTPAAAPVPEVKPDDVIARDFMAALNLPTDDIPPMPEPDLVTPTVTDPPTAEPEKAPETPPAERRTVVKKAAKPAPVVALAHAVPPVAQPAPAPVLAPAAPEPPKLDLNEDQQELLEVVRFAEGAKLEGFAGQAKALETYFTKLKTFAETNPDLTEDDEAFRNFVQTHQPKISPSALKKAERAQIGAEIEARAKAKIDEELKAIREEKRLTDLKPKIEQEFEKAKAELAGTKVGTEPLADVVKAVEKDPEAAADEFPIEAPIIKETLELARAYIEIDSRAVSFDPTNRQHAAISNFIFSQADKIKALPPEKQISQGRRFLDPAEYVQVATQNPAAIHQYWTLERQDVLKMLHANAAKTAERNRDRITKALSRKKGTETVPPKQEERVVIPAVPPAPIQNGKPNATKEVYDEATQLLVPGWKPGDAP